jgi:hypothetical protein
MKNLQKMGGLAALYMALAYLVNIVLFLFVLDYPNIVSADQKVALLVENSMLIYATNLSAYVFFGVVLVILTLALYDRLKKCAPVLMRLAAVIGFIWAGSLIASGMISNAAIDPITAMYAINPAQAAVSWTVIETIALGMAGVGGELLGGLWMLLISWTALQAREYPKGLNVLGIAIGVVGFISVLPGLNDLGSLFGMLQLIWFIWVGIVMLRQKTTLAN